MKLYDFFNGTKSCQKVTSFIVYRSYYYPVKNVIDGDLCEQYTTLEATKQKSIAEELDRTPADVSKKLEDIRTRYAF